MHHTLAAATQLPAWRTAAAERGRRCELTACHSLAASDGVLPPSPRVSVARLICGQANLRSELPGRLSLLALEVWTISIYGRMQCASAEERAGVEQPRLPTFTVEHAALSDEDAAFTFEVEYFRGSGGEESVSEMRAAWSSPDSWPRREFRARCDEGRVLVVKESDAALPPVGYLRWNRCGSEECACGGTAACIGHIFVALSWRRQGVAEALLANFCKEAKIGGFKQSCLSVEAWNDGARALYLKHGYRPSCEKAHSTCTARSCGTADSNPPSETLLLDLPAPESVL